jgi:hypothetical protein
MPYFRISFRSRLTAVSLGLSIAGALLLSGCASAPKEAPPAQVVCPSGVPAGVQCWRGARLSGLALFAGKTRPMERCVGGACARRPRFG